MTITIIISLHEAIVAEELVVGAVVTADWLVDESANIQTVVVVSVVASHRRAEHKCSKHENKLQLRIRHLGDYLTECDFVASSLPLKYHFYNKVLIACKLASRTEIISHK